MLIFQGVSFDVSSISDTVLAPRPSPAKRACDASWNQRSYASRAWYPSTCLGSNRWKRIVGWGDHFEGEVGFFMTCNFNRKSGCLLVQGLFEVDICLRFITLFTPTMKLGRRRSSKSTVQVGFLTYFFKVSLIRDTRHLHPENVT